MLWITIVPSFLLVLKRKAIRELLGFQKRFSISLSFAILGMHPAIEVSYAGFAKFFCGYDDVLVNGYMENKFTEIFVFESLLYTKLKGQILRKFSLESKRSCEGVMVLLLMTSCHVMNFSIS